jgi:hypothetical protein
MALGVFATLWNLLGIPAAINNSIQLSERAVRLFQKRPKSVGAATVLILLGISFGLGSWITRRSMSSPAKPSSPAQVSTVSPKPVTPAQPAPPQPAATAAPVAKAAPVVHRTKPKKRNPAPTATSAQSDAPVTPAPVAPPCDQPGGVDVQNVRAMNTTEAGFRINGATCVHMDGVTTDNTGRVGVDLKNIGTPPSQPAGTPVAPAPPPQ